MDHVTIIDGARPFSIDETVTRVESDIDQPAAEERLAERQAQLRELQELMFASEANGVLVVLQGMDAAGKDVIIQNVFATATAEAIRVEHLSRQSEEEAHDFLWRAHAVCPAPGSS
jgi:polyphosphate kinase 2 (PPK2 family)